MREIPREVILRYAYKNKIDISAAEELFNELELFLDSAADSASSPGAAVDDAWHEFILHTRLYADYCEGRYGAFIHHIPQSPLLLDGDPKGGQGTKKCCGTGVQAEIDGAVAVITVRPRCSTDCRRSHAGEEMSL